jgi:hypothetical protein
MAQKSHNNCLDDSGARQSGARPKSSSIPLLMHVHGIGTKFLSPGNASWQPRLNFKSTHALPLLIEFLGPYSWHGAPDTRSVFTAPVASQQGINLWTIALPDGSITYYVGETGRSFALRMAEHFQEHAACMYTLYGPEQFARGTKVKLWSGRMGKEKRSVADCVSQSVVFAPQITATTPPFRFRVGIQ